MLALTLAFLLLAAFLAWLSYRPWPLAFQFIDPADIARWEACQRLRDPWLGGPI